ncbi:MAG TPA: hypothetical protein VHQ64_19900 [Pyrinomonadaceae bacterium]|nr:hypothetical protein [Pyrinomonadaceae bacterium]
MFRRAHTLTKSAAGRKSGKDVQRLAARSFKPRIAPSIIRLSAAIESPPSSVGGMVAKPMAEAFG